MNNAVQVRVINGKEVKAKFRTIHKKMCKRCSKPFESIFVRQKYCGRQCYMHGVHYRAKEWLATADGCSWRKKHRIEMNRRIRTAVLQKLGRVCKQCGYSDARALHIDHVFGDGIKERDRRRQIYAQIMRDEIDISRYQLLCSNCNWIKRWENNEGSNYKDYNEYLKNIPK